MCKFVTEYVQIINKLNINFLLIKNNEKVIIYAFARGSSAT